MPTRYPVRPIFIEPETQAVPRERFWRRRKHAAGCLVLAILCVPLLVLGWYGWQTIGEIGKTQSESVVSLPTRDVAQMSPVAGPTSTNVPAPNPISVARGMVDANRQSGAMDVHEMWKDTPQLTVLVVGIDTSAAERADVVVLVRIDFTHDKVSAAALPPDLVMRSGQTLRASYADARHRDPGNAIAGVVAVRNAIEQDLSVPIQDYLLVDYDGVAKAIDASGGIDLSVPEAVKDPTYLNANGTPESMTIAVGQQHFNGDQALAYARMKADAPLAERTSRQIRVLTALLRQYRGISSLTRLSNAVQSLRGAVYTSFSWREQLALAMYASSFSSSDAHLTSVDEAHLSVRRTSGGRELTGDLGGIRYEIQTALSGSSADPASPVATPTRS